MGEYWYFGGEKSESRRQVSQGFLIILTSKNSMLKTTNKIDRIYRLKSQTSDYNFKVSKIHGCQLVRQADMGFDFYIGSCQSFNQPTPKILLCFDYTHTNECHT